MLFVYGRTPRQDFPQLYVPIKFEKWKWIWLVDEKVHLSTYELIDNNCFYILIHWKIEWMT